jgi:hypothetical protein
MTCKDCNCEKDHEETNKQVNLIFYKPIIIKKEEAETINWDKVWLIEEVNDTLLVYYYKEYKLKPGDKFKTTFFVYYYSSVIIKSNV